jgi:hypothetical protein
MPNRPEITESHYDCPRIHRGVTIKTAVHSQYGQHQFAINVMHRRLSCSGMPVCKLFPLGRFPSGPQGGLATGCPLIETRSTTGK